MKLNGLLLVLLTGITITALAVPPLLNACYIGLAMHAIRGPKQAIESFSILFLILMGNLLFFSGGIKALRWVVILSGFAGVIWTSLSTRSSVRGDISLMVIGLFFAVMLPVTWITSFIPEVSLFKLISFVVGVFTIFYAFRLTSQLKEYWRSWFFTWMMFLLLASWLVLPLGFGYARNGTGFQGIFNHPQVLGPVAGILGAWFTAHLMFTPGRKNGMIIALLVSSLVFIFLSQARIGLVILGGGFILAWLISTLNGIHVRIPRFGKQVLALVGVLGIFLIVLDYEAVQAFVMGFVQKRDVGSDLSSAFQNSRGFLIEASMANFRDYPVFGIGFGVPTQYQQGFAQLETFMGIPLGASIEKGFFPSALLEETGYVGATVTLLFIAGLLQQIIRSRQFPVLWFFLSALLLNIGEAVFFSIGGLGLFDWLVFGFCYNQTLPERAIWPSSGNVPAGAASLAHPVAGV